MRLRGAVHGMIARIDPRHRRDRTEFADRRVGDLRVVHDVGIVGHRDFEQDGPGAGLGIGAKLTAAYRRGRVDGRFRGKHFSGHGGSINRRKVTLVIDALDDSIMTGA